MKNILILAAAMALAVSANAQQKLQGPAAKNAKPWETKSEKPGYFVKSGKQSKVQGPLAKNARTWEQKNTETKILVVSAPSEEKVTSPIAKNANPWDNKKQSSDTGMYAKKSE